MRAETSIKCITFKAASLGWFFVLCLIDLIEFTYSLFVAFLFSENTTDGERKTGLGFCTLPN